MSKLTDSQLVILSAAAARDSGTVLPLPKSCKLNQGAAAIVLKSLIKKKLIAECPATGSEATWRSGKDGSRFGLAITAAGSEAVGIVPDEAPMPPKDTKPSRARPKAAKPTLRKAKTDPHKDASAGTKQALLIDLLKRKTGASIDEAIEVTGWQAHSVRGAISGTLKKKLGFDVSSQRIDGVRRYRIAG